MAPIVDPILRVVLFAFSVIILGMMGAVVRDNKAARFSFSVFAASFSILFGVFYGLIQGFVEAITIPIIMIALDFMNFVFLLSGASALSDRIKVVNCSNEENRLRRGLYGASQCRLVQASVAFLFLAWAVSAALLILQVLAAVKQGSFGFGPVRKRPAVPRTGVPTVSQV